MGRFVAHGATLDEMAAGERAAYRLVADVRTNGPGRFDRASHSKPEASGLRGNNARVSPSPRRHLAKTSDEDALDPCFEEEVEARGVEGQRDAVFICAADH